jgi:NifB/MoaA-like Fe-S oxidoreductase
VNVTGLLTATDVLGCLEEDLCGQVVLLPDIMLNADRLTLDGTPAAELEGLLGRRGARARFVQMTPPGVLAAVNEM